MQSKVTWMLLALATGATGWAQTTNYLGPGVLSRGAGDIGARAGEQADIRVSASVNAIYDTGILPVSVDANGQLADPKASMGVEGRLAAYGTHRGKRYQLGLDYTGMYRHYLENSFYNGSDQALTLGYSVQPSKRWIVEMRGTGGEVTFANSGLYGYSTESFDPVTSNIFDSRSVFVQGSMDITYLMSTRTYFQFGGYGFKVDRRNKALIGANGYDLRGSLNHRMSRETTVGVMFDHSHFDYPRAFGDSDINSYQAFWARSIGRDWSINISAGVYQLETEGLQQVRLDPAVADILGISTGIQTFYRKNTLPAASVTLARRFRRGSFTLAYDRKITPGNGVYLTSASEDASAGLRYEATRKWAFSGSGGYTSARSAGQNLAPYRGIFGGVGATYALLHSLQMLLRYDIRQQQIDQTNGFNKASYRVSFGLSFSPGDIPLTLW